MDLYLLILIILIVAAIIDLMVGVANDAVNFLNSAIGAKVAPRTVIMVIATLGILIGVTFSSGLMEVARKGIFNPQYFTLPEVMFIFGAVMLTDVLLLDFFNTFGLPTSTTVSLVFELLGAAFAVSMIKVIQASDSIAMVFTYLNTARAVTIVFAIVASVVIAFIVGSFAQYVSRMIFTFDYHKRIRRYGAIWGGVALTMITFFIILKGSKGASFITPETSAWIKGNLDLIALASFVVWTVLLQFTMWFTRINILKPIVLMGTFALAMAFAANDLVNFIGAPLGGLSAYMSSLDSANPLLQTMESLAEPVRANTWLLLLAGTIMAVTLWLNKKARSVTATAVSLGRQGEGTERFESIGPARAIVRIVLTFFTAVGKITPQPIKDRVERRFDSKQYNPIPDEHGELPAFDLVRAAVNLFVAAALISVGTSLKLPLSTTYVTFMVSMATALPDRAWGRETAVYRVSGVMTVVGGWFFTALMASTVAAILATIMFFGEWFGVIALLIVIGTIFYRTTILHKKREREFTERESLEFGQITNLDEALQQLASDVGKYVTTVGNAIELTTQGLVDENRIQLKEARDLAKTLGKRSKQMSNKILRTSKIDVEADSESENEKNYAQAIGALQQLTRSLRNLAYQTYHHIDNNHQGMDPDQTEELKRLDTEIRTIIQRSAKAMNEHDYSDYTEINESVTELNQILRKFDKRQIKRSKKEKYTTRAGLLYLEILSDTEEIAFHTLTLLEVCKNCSPPDEQLKPLDVSARKKVAQIISRRRRQVESEAGEEALADTVISEEMTSEADTEGETPSDDVSSEVPPDTGKPDESGTPDDDAKKKVSDKKKKSSGKSKK